MMELSLASGKTDADIVKQNEFLKYVAPSSHLLDEKMGMCGCACVKYATLPTSMACHFRHTLALGLARHIFARRTRPVATIVRIASKTIRGTFNKQQPSSKLFMGSAKCELMLATSTGRKNKPWPKVKNN
eukprot:TRINITY_DN99819_c0_g1_i1.p1 TRINITY_DN99819_c0_g1~~TRINITY_DN99819_c0_g1_i1.p1  ORF type:complete len:130 (+),score=14.56 TRINITY_DN99819_c0_g1_i1:2-391(+)